MFHRIQQYQLIDKGGRWYRPRAYGDPQWDGTWAGWLVFFPIDGTSPIAPGDRETTQSTLEALAVWAAGLSSVYLDGALDRALRVALRTPLIDQLAQAEYEALEDAEQLETAAEIERGAADLDEAAAKAARADAERIHRERLASEGGLAATEEAAARLEAKIHEQAARDARAVAADAARRRRALQPEGKPETQNKTHAGKKK